MVFSVLLLVEGVTRTNLNINTGIPWRGTHTEFPPIVGLLGGLTEVCFAFFGLLVGYFHLVHGLANRIVLFACLGTEFLFGWFTFSIYIFAMPSFEANRATQKFPNMSWTATRAVYVMGLLGSFAECAALQGKEQTGRLHRGRMIFFTCLLILKGASEITVGALFDKADGDAEFAKPVADPPFVVTKPALLIAGGIWVTITGLIGLSIAVAHVPKHGLGFSVLSFFTYLVVIALDDLGSVGIAPAAIPVGALQVGLAFALAFMPAYSGAHLEGEEIMAVEAQPEYGNGGGDVGSKHQVAPHLQAHPV
ncbi:hypothetical protein WJX73_009518 [Symbiochloris irregularis]|uniref:Uncharacterized protein n=1 Tax=Symbiochloris irregularis TaxID=706552 RepID=A0AAW1P2G9_9CHLO